VFLANTNIVLTDEATSALDLRVEASVHCNMMAEAEEKTFMFIT